MAETITFMDGIAIYYSYNGRHIGWQNHHDIIVERLGEGSTTDDAYEHLLKHNDNVDMFFNSLPRYGSYREDEELFKQKIRLHLSPRTAFQFPSKKTISFSLLQIFSIMQDGRFGDTHMFYNKISRMVGFGLDSRSNFPKIAKDMVASQFPEIETYYGRFKGLAENRLSQELESMRMTEIQIVPLLQPTHKWEDEKIIPLETGRRNVLFATPIAIDTLQVGYVDAFSRHISLILLDIFERDKTNFKRSFDELFLKKEFFDIYFNQNRIHPEVFERFIHKKDLLLNFKTYLEQEYGFKYITRLTYRSR